jgi:TPR repeat protein
LPNTVMNENDIDGAEIPEDIRSLIERYTNLCKDEYYFTLAKGNFYEYLKLKTEFDSDADAAYLSAYIFISRIETIDDYEYAFELIKTAANLGNENSIIILANSLRNGIFLNKLSVEVDHTKAYKLYSKFLSIDKILDDHIDHYTDDIFDDARKWIETCANYGDQEALLVLGVNAFESNNYALAVSYFEKNRNEESLLFLIKCYAEGLGVEVDYQKAFSLLDEYKSLSTEFVSQESVS